MTKTWFDGERIVTQEVDKPNKEWWDWYLSPPENWNEKYGDAFEWTPQEKILMQQLKEKNEVRNP
jgi:hypothetical protein